MLLRSSISTTKKFFQKTLETFKSYLSGGYQKLPKSPPCTPFPCHDQDHTFKELDKFYVDFTARWDDAEKGKCMKRSKRREKRQGQENESSQLSQSRHDMKQEVIGSDSIPNSRTVVPEKKGLDSRGEHHKRKNIVYSGKKYHQQVSKLNGLREERSYVVAQKLKELKMIDKSNEEHVLDVEEVLHYYSRLTCPAYLDIVDKFFMEMYSELFSINQSSSHVYNSRSGLHPSFNELY